MREIGELINCGRARSVWQHAGHDSRVIKVQHHFHAEDANRLEWLIWRNAPAGVRAWLVPCYQISDCGIYLVQHKGEPVTGRPDGYPEFFSDCKTENWVRIGNRVVMCDYARRSIAEALGIC